MRATGLNKMYSEAPQPKWRANCIAIDSAKKQNSGHKGSPTPSKTATSTDDHGTGFDPKYYQSLTTLIVEDESIDQKLATVSAGRAGLDAIVVSTAAEAIEKIKQADSNNPIELLIIDFKMPNLDGLAASNLIKNQLGLASPPKIVLLSSFHKDEIFSGVTERDFIDDFMSKPITPEKLEQAICRIHLSSAQKNTPWPHTYDNKIDSQSHEINIEENSTDKTLKVENDQESDDKILAKTHILLAEDNPINQRVAVGILKQKSVQVTIANNGQEAIDKIRNANPTTFDLILMDMDMPKVDGYEATQTILSEPQYQHIPIVALTAHIAPEERQRCSDAGMVEYLTKPVKPQVLYQCILDHLN